MKLIQIFEWGDPKEGIDSPSISDDPVPYGFWLEIQESRFIRAGRKAMVKTLGNGMQSLWCNALCEHPQDEEEK